MPYFFLGMAATNYVNSLIPPSLLNRKKDTSTIPMEYSAELSAMIRDNGIPPTHFISVDYFFDANMPAETADLFITMLCVKLALPASSIGGAFWKPLGNTSTFFWISSSMTEAMLYSATVAIISHIFSESMVHLGQLCTVEVDFLLFKNKQESQLIVPLRFHSIGRLMTGTVIRLLDRIRRDL